MAEAQAAQTRGAGDTKSTSARWYSSHDLVGLLAVVAGLTSVVGLILWLARGIVLTDVKDVTALVGSVSGPIVALVSAYFGISAANNSASNQKDSSDKALQSTKDTSDQAIQSIKEAKDQAVAASLLADPNHPQTRQLLATLLPPQPAQPG